MMNPYNRKKKFLLIPLFLFALFVLPYVVQLLWNGILPEIIGVKTISYWQALGIFILSKILFGGSKFCGKNSERNQQVKKRFRERFMQMSSEEKQTFRQKWRERCQK